MAMEQRVREALKEVIDPEIGINVVDLGLIKEVVVEGSAVEVKMVLTTPGCPLAEYLIKQVMQKTESVEGVEKVEVTLLDEPWSWERLAQQRGVGIVKK